MRFLLLISLLLSSLSSFAQDFQVLNVSVKDSAEPLEMKCYAKKEGERQPVVLMLHGRGGYSAYPKLYEGYIEDLSVKGFKVCALSYYSEEDATIMTGGDKALKELTYRHRITAWIDNARQAVTALSESPDVDASRIGVLGFSQGAFISIGLAGTDSRVKALADIYGKVPEDFSVTIKKMPPTLILHGASDSVVPVTEAYVFEEILKKESVNYRMKIYPNADHGYDADPNSDVAKDSHLQVTRFFEEALNGSF